MSGRKRPLYWYVLAVLIVALWLATISGMVYVGVKLSSMQQVLETLKVR